MVPITPGKCSWERKGVGNRYVAYFCKFTKPSGWLQRVKDWLATEGKENKGQRIHPGQGFTHLEDEGWK